MNGIARLAGPRTLAFAFGLSLFSPLASGAQAAPIAYSTRGEILPGQYGDGSAPGYQGENVISFVGVTDGTFDDASSRFSLGQFHLAPLPPGGITYYNNTAFTIELNTSLGGNVVPSNSEMPYSSLRLSGALFGVVIGGDTSGVVAWINSVEPNPPIQTLLGSSTQPVLDLPFDLAEMDVSRPTLLNPSSRNGGRTEFNTVPEPTTIALILVTFAGLGLRRRIRAGRNA